MELPDCGKTNSDAMLFALKDVKSVSGKQILLDLWTKVPFMPVPNVSEHYSPAYDWGGYLQLTKDYLDFPVYEVWTFLHWVRVNEAEFIETMKIHFGC